MRKGSQEVFTGQEKEQQTSGWESAIAEAEHQITAYEMRITKLRLAIETFHEMKERGEPFIPESQSQSNVAA